MKTELPDVQATVVDWCNNVSRSVTRRSLQDHMSLISHKLRVYGIPGYESLSFLDWEKRRRHEFKHNLLDTLTYKLFKIKTFTPARITFVTEETMRAASGKVIILNKDITLERTSDAADWQSVEEVVHEWQTEE